MTAEEALAKLEADARGDAGIRAALVLFRAGHGLARSLSDLLDVPAAADTPVPDTRPEGKRGRR